MKKYNRCFIALGKEHLFENIAKLSILNEVQLTEHYCIDISALLSRGRSLSDDAVQIFSLNHDVRSCRCPFVTPAFVLPTDSFASLPV